MKKILAIVGMCGAGKSVVCEYLESLGFEISYVKNDEEGLVSFDDLKNLIREDTILVSICAVNHETGVIISDGYDWLDEVVIFEVTYDAEGKMIASLGLASITIQSNCITHYIDLSNNLFFNIILFYFKLFNYSAIVSSVSATTCSIVSVSSVKSCSAAGSKLSPCFPSITAFAITSAINLTALIASSFPGIG